jgi:hypothetical protein
LPQRLQQLGYQTAGIGQTHHWYLGTKIAPDLEREPSKRGFEFRVLQKSIASGQDEPDSLLMGEEASSMG